MEIIRAVQTAIMLTDTVKVIRHHSDEPSRLQAAYLVHPEAFDQSSTER